MPGHHVQAGRSGTVRWWAPRRLSWWIGLLVAIGSLCFFMGPFPGFVQLVGSSADGTVFFVGSLFFTSAALLPDSWDAERLGPDDEPAVGAVAT